jgi:D-amino-acid dehydrogenase
MATRHANLWLAFGHGHMGFSMGPITGRLIAEMISGTRPIIDTAPFGLARFS